MTKFTPGERVAAYQGTDRYTGKVTHASESCVTILLDTPTYAGARYLGVHPKQCRKLVKKARRHRIWARFEGSTLGGVTDHKPTCGLWVEFVEVRKREKK